MARYDDLNTSTIGYSTVFSALLLIVIIFSIQGLSYYWENSEVERKKGMTEYTSALKVLDEQRSSLAKYEWVEVPAPEPAPGEVAKPATKRLQIPLTRAKELILQELKSEKAGEANPGA
jgi:hypothetical protein